MKDKPKPKPTAAEITDGIKALSPDERRAQSQRACIAIMERFDLTSGDVAGITAAIFCDVFQYHRKSFRDAQTALRQTWMASEGKSKPSAILKPGEN